MSKSSSTFLPLNPNLSYSASASKANSSTNSMKDKIHPVAVQTGNNFVDLSDIDPTSVEFQAGLVYGRSIAHSALHRNWKHGTAAFIFWFVTIAVVIWLLLFSLARPWINNPDGTVNVAKVLWTSIIVALVLVSFIWLLKAVISC